MVLMGLKIKMFKLSQKNYLGAVWRASPKVFPRTLNPAQKWVTRMSNKRAQKRIFLGPKHERNCWEQLEMGERIGVPPKNNGESLTPSQKTDNLWLKKKEWMWLWSKSNSIWPHKVTQNNSLWGQKRHWLFSGFPIWVHSAKQECIGDFIGSQGSR